METVEGLLGGRGPMRPPFAYIRRIPAALPAIEELYKKQRAPTTGVVSARSSGDRNYALLTTLHRLVEIGIE
jgi:hypothetical protein